jgi:hypothetical protein
LTGTARHLRTREIPREIGRALVALGGLAAWGGALALIVG